VQHFHLECADGETLAVPEEMIELAAVTLEIGRVEHGPEAPLRIMCSPMPTLAPVLSFRYGAPDR
jgi:hypothetical protein